MFCFLLSILTLTAPLPEEAYSEAVTLFVDDYIEDLLDDVELPSEHFLPFVEGTLQGIAFFAGQQNMVPVFKTFASYDQKPLDLTLLSNSLKQLPKITIDQTHWIQCFQSALESFASQASQNLESLDYKKRLNLFGQILTLGLINDNLIEHLENKGNFDWTREIDFEDIGVNAIVFLLNPTEQTQNDLIETIFELKTLFQN